MSGAFLPEPVADQQQKVKTSSESSDLPSARSSSKKAKILVQEEKLQEGLKTPLTQVRFTLILQGKILSISTRASSSYTYIEQCRTKVVENDGI